MTVPSATSRTNEKRTAFFGNQGQGRAAMSRFHAPPGSEHLFDPLNREYESAGEYPPDFARWLNGTLTRFCGADFHDRCKGTISTIGIESPCLCECHVPVGAR